MRKFILIASLLLFALNSWAETVTVCSSGCDETTVQGAFDNHDLAPGDVVEIRADSPGGTVTFRESNVTPGSNDEGDASNQLTIQGRSGDTVIINGAQLVSTWGDEGSNVWSATLAANPWSVWFDGTLGTEVASQGAVTSANKWYWNSNVLYIYSTSDPDTAYTNPGIEAPTNNYCVFADDRDYITWSNFTVIHGGFDGLRHENSTGIIADHLTAYYNGWEALGGNHGEGLSFAGITGLTVQYCYSHDNGWNSISIVRDSTNVIVQYSRGDNGHQGFDFKAEDFHDASLGGSKEVGNMSNVVIRYCTATGNAYYGIYFEDDDEGHLSSVTAHGNLVYSNGYTGMGFMKDEGSVIDTVQCTNNTIWNNGATASVDWGIGLEAYTTNGVFKNNIIFNNVGGSVTPNDRELQIDDEGGDVNVLDYNLVWDSEDTSIYRWDGTAYTHSALQSAGQQTHGLSEDPILYSNFVPYSTSPCVDEGVDLGDGNTYRVLNPALNLAGGWPNYVFTLNPDEHGWPIGAYGRSAHTMSIP